MGGEYQPPCKSNKSIAGVVHKGQPHAGVVLTVDGDRAQ